MKRKLIKRNKKFLSHRLKYLDPSFGGATLTWQPVYRVSLFNDRFIIKIISWRWFPCQAELREAATTLLITECLFI